MVIIDAKTWPAKEKIKEGLLAEKNIKPSTLIRQYNVSIVKSSEVYQLAKIKKGSNALEVANKYQESGLVVFAHPNFIAQVEKHQVLPNDQ